MKLILVFAFLALICMARSAPPPTSTSRVLIYQHYDDDNHEITHDEVKPHEDDVEVDDDDDDETTTTTTTTTRRSTFAFPTRNRNLIPSRRPIQNQRASSVRTTTIADDEDQEETTNEYDGDFKHIRNFRKYFQQLMEDIRKLVRNLTGYDFGTSPRQQYNQDEE